MFGGRYFTDEERKKIKENKQKEKEVNHYQFEAVQRMKHAEGDYKIKNYKDRW